MSSFTTNLFKSIAFQESAIDMKFDLGFVWVLEEEIAKRRVLIREMGALGERGVAANSLECLKQTHARETAKLVALTDATAESLVDIHEKERHVAKMDLND
ncbi:hypothetical protein Tco_0660677 [Tanacetum coccineum]